MTRPHFTISRERVRAILPLARAYVSDATVDSIHRALVLDFPGIDLAGEPEKSLRSYRHALDDLAPRLLVRLAVANLVQFTGATVVDSETRSSLAEVSRILGIGALEPGAPL